MKQSAITEPYTEPDPDIVEVVLNACLAQGFDAEAARSIRLAIYQEFGGRRVYVPKRKKYLTREQREQVLQDVLSDQSNEEIQNKHNISRSTIYRLIKS